MHQTLALLRQRWILLMFGVLSPVYGILTVEMIRPIVADVDYLGIGPGAVGFRGLVGLIVCIRFVLIAREIWLKYDSVINWWAAIRELLLWLAIFPASLLLGKVIFTYIPPWDPIVGCILGPVAAIYFLKDVGWPQAQPADQTAFRRGTQVLTPEQAEQTLVSLSHSGPQTEGKLSANTPNPVQALNNFSPGMDPPVRWAGFDLPSWAIEGHCCVVGAPGAGKTLMIRSLMASVLPHIRNGADRRAIVYDVKNDSISQLNDMRLTCPIRILNPFDTRCYAWDIAADLKDPDTADQYAAILIPSKENEKDNFFTDAARMLVGGALKVFIITQKPWTLRDLIQVTATEDRLKQVLEATPYTVNLVHRYFEPKDTFRNILATIGNSMVRLESVAAVWDKMPRDRWFSINDWCLNESSVLVLGRQFDRSETLTLLNQIIFRRIAEVLLSGAESPNRWKMWFFIDELKEGGRLDGLSELLTNGRSKGVRVALGFQDIEGLRETYGEHLANEMPGMCANRSILHLRSSFTAEWASDQVGEVENFEFVTSLGTSTDKDGNVTNSNNTSKNIEARRALLPSEFLSFALSKGGSVFGAHIIPALRGVIPRIVSYPFHQPREKENFSPRTDLNDMLLAPWTADDDKRLGLRIAVAEQIEQKQTQNQDVKTISTLDQIGRMNRSRPSQ